MTTGKKAYSYIRMSTETQLKGDSLRRQIAMTETFAMENGFVLDRTFDLHDIGRSAYDGSNIEKGQLGRFLQAVKDGKIERGSYLIVESLDRLSRQKARPSLTMFLGLLEHGINIVTLIDRRIYTPDADHMELIMSLGSLARAHEESLHKSQRLSSAWENKRKDTRAGAGNLTSRCKGWLVARADGKGFDPRPERVEIVILIFHWAADLGMGADQIARRLNGQRVPTFGHSQGWHKSYVLKILHDRAVLGEFQMYTRAGGKRQPAGEVLQGYYPAVVDENLFYRAQAALAKRRQNGGGRKGPRISNLFSKLAYCHVCGHRIAFRNRGSKGGGSLICGGVLRGLQCSGRPWNYSKFETSVLLFITELDLKTLTSDLAAKNARRSIEDDIREIEGRLNDAKCRRSRAFDMIMGSEATDFLVQQLRVLDATVAALENQLVDAKQRHRMLTAEHEALIESHDESARLIKELQAEDTGAAYEMRSALAARLRDLVERIEIWATDLGPISDAASESIRHWCTERGKDPDEFLALAQQNRSFYIKFRNGAWAWVSPRGDDPTKLKLLAREGLFRIFDPDVHRFLCEGGIRSDSWEEFVLIESAAGFPVDWARGDMLMYMKRGREWSPAPYKFPSVFYQMPGFSRPSTPFGLLPLCDPRIRLEACDERHISLSRRIEQGPAGQRGEGGFSLSDIKAVCKHLGIGFKWTGRHIALSYPVSPERSNAEAGSETFG
jgi:DNA invertase Pin-like site-specific DNA recombinase